MRKNTISTSKKILFVIFILFIYFIICEVFLRIFWEPEAKKPYPYLKNPFLRHNYFPNAELRVLGVFAVNQPVSVKTNAFGFRSSSMKSVEKGNNTYRIFFLGDSTVEQLDFPEKYTSWKIIEDYLNKGSEDMRFECINAGKSGSLSSDCLALLAHELLYYDPDMVIVMNATNDIVINFNKDYNIFLKKPVSYAPSLKEVLRGVYRNVYLLLFLRKEIYDRIRCPTLEEIRENWRRAPKITTSYFLSIEPFKKNIRSLIGIAKSHNIRICFLTQPSLLHENMTEDEKKIIWGAITEDGTTQSIPTFINSMNLYNEQVKIICEQNNVEYIDLANMVPKDLRYFTDQVHCKPEGARLIADIISKYLWDNRSRFKKAGEF